MTELGFGEGSPVHLSLSASSPPFLPESGLRKQFNPAIVPGFLYPFSAKNRDTQGSIRTSSQTVLSVRHLVIHSLPRNGFAKRNPPV